MASSKKQAAKQNDPSTEEKIKIAARIVFHKKGFAATRTRDIAEEANINHALLNYYFRSKKKLFDIIMMETMQGFLNSLTNVFNDTTSTLEQKIEDICSSYIDTLLDKPEIPLFVLSELSANPKDFALKINAREKIAQSIFMKQLTDQLKKNKMGSQHPLHYIMNIMALMVFPFIGNPILKNIAGLKQSEFDTLMLERKKLIPMWVNQMLKLK